MEKKKVVGRYRKWVETLYVKQGNREEPEKKKQPIMSTHDWRNDCLSPNI